jgi:hypothetical protein
MLEHGNLHFSPLFHPRTVSCIYLRTCYSHKQGDTDSRPHYAHIVLAEELPEIGNATLVHKGTDKSNAREIEITSKAS